MKSPWNWIGISLVSGVGIFIVSPTLHETPTPLNGWRLRELVVFVTGTVAFVPMTLSRAIAMRPA